MKKTVNICDVCGDEYGECYDYSVAIGGFKKKTEIDVRSSYHKGGTSGVSRWVDVDLCPACKQSALLTAARWWVRQSAKPGFKQLEFFASIHAGDELK